MVNRKDSVPQNVSLYYHGKDREIKPMNALGNSSKSQDPEGCFEVKAISNVPLT